MPATWRGVTGSPLNKAAPARTIGGIDPCNKVMFTALVQ